MWQSIHALLHLVPEAIRVGPLGLVAQWAMERTIGNLGQEIKQPSNPYANLAQRGLFRAQVNVLKAMIPDLEPETSSIPRGGVIWDLGIIFCVLRMRLLMRFGSVKLQSLLSIFMMRDIRFLRIGNLLLFGGPGYVFQTDKFLALLGRKEVWQRSDRLGM